MPLDRHWLIGTARHEREALGRTVQYAPPERWDAPTPAEGWQARDVLAHLAATEVAAAQTIAGEDRTEFEEFLKDTGARQFTVEGFHGYNAWAVKRRAETPVISLALEWGRGADLLLARASQLADERWGEKVPWPVDPIRVPSFLQSRVCEWWVHGEDVRSAVGLPSRREHAPIHCVNDLSIRTIPYALQLEDAIVPRKVVEISLDGVGEGTWRQSLAPREKPAEDARTDAYINGSGHAFALVAAHRADPEQLLYDGLLLVGGERDLAELVLHNIRYFA
jgi:uncharacterized protein (TIGR03083 family)